MPAGGRLHHTGQHAFGVTAKEWLRDSDDSFLARGNQKLDHPTTTSGLSSSNYDLWLELAEVVSQCPGLLQVLKDPQGSCS